MIDQRKLTSATKLARQALSDALGATKYHRAAYDGQLDLLCDASKREANTPMLEKGLTPTLLAAQTGRLEALRMLVGRGGDPEICDATGSNCLHLAASQNHLNCVSFLVNFGINMWSLDNQWHTAKDVAAISQAKKVLDYLDQVMARQSAINTKQVQKFKEKAKRATEKRLKQLRKSQLKAMKLKEREERQFFKLSNSRPMLKNALSISDIRLVGKPTLIEYSPSYTCGGLGKSSCQLGRLTSANDLRNTNHCKTANYIHQQRQQISGTELKASSQTDLTNIDFAADAIGERLNQRFASSSSNVSNCVRKLQKASALSPALAFTNEVSRVDNNCDSKLRLNQHHDDNSRKNLNNARAHHRPLSHKFEYDSGVSGGSSISMLSSRNSQSSSNQTRFSGSSSGSTRTTTTTTTISTLNTSSRPRFSDLVAIKPINLKEASSSPTTSIGGASGRAGDAHSNANTSSLLESTSTKKSRALSGSSKLNNLKKLLKVSHKSSNIHKLNDKLDKAGLPEDSNNGNLDVAKSSSTTIFRTYNKYANCASMFDLSNEEAISCNSRGHKLSSTNNCQIEETEQQQKLGFKKSSKQTTRANKINKLMTQDQKDLNHDCDNRNNCDIFRTSGGFSNKNPKFQNIKWPPAPALLTRALSQPDFCCISTIQQQDGSEDLSREQDRNIDSPIKESNELDGKFVGNNGEISVSRVANQTSLMMKSPATTGEAKSEDNSKRRSHEENRSSRRAGENSNADDDRQAFQHHLMLNQCLSQLKLHRKHQQLHPVVSANNQLGHKQQDGNDKHPSRFNNKDKMIRLEGKVLASNELLHHQRQAGDMPLKPSLIKQHQMMLVNPSVDQHKLADSIGSASSLVQLGIDSSSSSSSSSSGPSTRTTNSIAGSSSKISGSTSRPSNAHTTNRAADQQMHVQQMVTNEYSGCNSGLSLESFLANNGLNDLKEIFFREMIDFESLLLLNEFDLKSLGILLGPRRKILKALGSYKKTLEHDDKMGWDRIAQLNTVEHLAPPKPPPLPKTIPDRNSRHTEKIKVVDTKL